MSFFFCVKYMYPFKDTYFHSYMRNWMVILVQNTTIESVTDNVGVITAHARVNASDESGFTFVHCNINGTGRNELGRAWKERPRVIFAYTYMGPIITPQGWSDYNKPERQRYVCMLLFPICPQGRIHELNFFFF